AFVEFAAKEDAEKVGALEKVELDGTELAVMTLPKYHDKKQEEGRLPIDTRNPDHVYGDEAEVEATLAKKRTRQDKEDQRGAKRQNVEGYDDVTGQAVSGSDAPASGARLVSAEELKDRVLKVTSVPSDVKYFDLKTTLMDWSDKFAFIEYRD